MSAMVDLLVTETFFKFISQSVEKLWPKKTIFAEEDRKNRKNLKTEYSSSLAAQNDRNGRINGYENHF